MGKIWRSWRRASAGRPERSRRILIGLSALVLLPCLACSGGSDGDSGISASFTPSGTAAAPDRVRLRQGSAAGDTVTLQVALSGPTTSSDIYSFAFDLVLSDASVARYVPGSATIGNALIPTGSQGTTLGVSQSGNRVVVGVSKTVGGAGNGVGAIEATVVSLVFELLRGGSTTVTFAGSPANPQNPTNDPAALDSNLAVIASIDFDAAAGTLTGL